MYKETLMNSPLPNFKRKKEEKNTEEEKMEYKEKSSNKSEEHKKECNDANFFLSFICLLEGWKTKCKNLHWSANKKNIHVYLDEFLDILSDYQDSIAEDEMGIYGKMDSNAIKGIPCGCLNAKHFIDTVKCETLQFYENISCCPELSGIKSETETFIHNINKYIYLFNLCDI